MKKQLFIILLCYTYSTSTLGITTSSLTEIPSIELAVFNLKWYLGNCAQGSYMGDFPIHDSFRMGFANNGTRRITLSEINLTFVKVSYSCESERITIVIAGNAGLPIALYPGYYWIYNVTCPGGQISRIDAQIVVDDSHVITFGAVVGYGLIEDEYKILSTWDNYQLYTENTGALNPIGFTLGITALIGVILIVLVQSLKKIPV